MRVWVLRLLRQNVVSTRHQDREVSSLRLQSLVIFPDLQLKSYFKFLNIYCDIHLWHKVLALINVLKAQGIVPYELDVVVMGDPTCAVISDPVHHGDADILNLPVSITPMPPVPPVLPLGKFTRASRCFSVFSCVNL